MCEDQCNCKGSCDCHCEGTCDCHCSGDHHRDCCCGGGHAFQRRYQTKAEQAAELESYLADLKKEVQAVEERLADLKK